MELFKSIAKAAFKIQSSNRRKYPLIVFGFGNTSNLQHENKFFDFGYISDKHNVNIVAETMSRISGNNTVTKAIIPELFPKVDIRSLYSGKIKIDDDDLLIIVGKKNEVFFDKKIEFKLKNKIRKRILFVEICKDNIHWQYKNYNPEYKTMISNNPLENICKKVGENLIQMYHSGSFNNLIFPLYRASKRKRVSEQEARFLFAYEIMKNGDFDFAVEVPTKLRYKGFSTHSPTVFFNDEDGRSASIDMSIFKKNDNKKPFINIEFKKGQPTQSSITKDLLKLLFEPHKYGIFFHILEHSDSRTLTSLVKKFNSSFNNISSQKLNTQCPIIFFRIVILEEDINESRYSGSDYDTSKTTKLDESNFQDL